MLKISVLASGNLGYDLVRYIYDKYSIVSIFSDKNSIKINEFAASKGIAFFSGNPRNGRAQNFINKNDIDLLLSINYIFLVEKDLINWPKLAAINFHGSLLPKYRGRTPHIWAIINNEKVCGVTAHFIEEGCDNGDIIHQAIITIDENDTGASILGKYHLIYPDIVDEVIKKFCENSIIRFPQDESKSTYFGKRCPEDGLIKWNWQKERIRNWIRALAFPYPGAFTYFNNTKIIIDEIEFDETGFSNDIKDGMILGINPVIVKTPNGAIRITKFRDEQIKQVITIGDNSIFLDNLVSQ